MGNNNGIVGNRQRPGMKVVFSTVGMKDSSGILATFWPELKINNHKSEILTASLPCGNPIKWLLDFSVVQPGGAIVSIAIRLIDAPTDELSAKITFAFINSLGADATKFEKTSRKFTKNGDSWSFNKFFERSELSNFLFGNLFTIVCCINLCENESAIVVPNCRILENMGNMFEESLLTDFCIMAGDKEFKVNKCILACQSPVFRAMFEHEMVENKTEMVKIDDIQSEVVEQMLRFIYTGNSSKLKEMAKELMAAAEKYQLDRLKALCELSLVNSIENENVCELLVLADLHLAKQLKVCAIKYIQMHTKEVMKTEGWKMLKANYGKLFGELLEMMVASK